MCKWPVDLGRLITFISGGSSSLDACTAAKMAAGRESIASQAAKPQNVSRFSCPSLGQEIKKKLITDGSEQVSLLTYKSRTQSNF